MKLSYLMHPWINNISYVLDCEIYGLQNNSKQIKSGFLFFAYPGSTLDGRLFMMEALQFGASAIVYESYNIPTNCKFPINIPCIPFFRLRKNLSKIVKRYYFISSNKNIIITGVTGTNGKTTITYQLAQACTMLNSLSFYIGTLGAGFIGNLEFLQNTTPDSLIFFQFLKDCQKKYVKNIFMEVSSHAISQYRVNDIEFQNVVYTNISHDHLDCHLTMENYIKIKSSFFSSHNFKWVVINYDDLYKQFIIKSISKKAQIISYGINVNADVYVLKWKTVFLKTWCMIMSPWGKFELTINTLGLFNIYNMLAVFIILMILGFSLNEVILVFNKLKSVPGRMQIICHNPCIIIDYAHNPDAFKKVLSFFYKIKKKHVIVVFGCGGNRDQIKRPLMGYIASYYSDYLIITSDNPRYENSINIIEEIYLGARINKSCIYKIPNREYAIKKAIDIAQYQDIVLILGKGHEKFQEVMGKYFCFSDESIIRKYLNKNFF
ncbi:UDP-N-acetylmuramoyl-L-alanyl-D-glutamate--2,6-diaminopimelate ligase [Candidatus Legionella polyplacis]|uniref:UDP-N-acetylmuramoyl-L-alanyl-D-glutamate--2, 6-diaminopimelate ligase n=1 Tax=Candidatus Legionella polyplacis TaxID=2005262 RepID=UPI000C1ED1AD|nr:UDP-N-acetylmuramoyl-L-alanyl-D-glutamate--2,6-diaminopimelate ligase [Candidatus Legionella polyplacis]ATW01696.1 UDP-N-acetylmuramoyl-L-alanyl-D-glutamate--2,6-diaminopimelate ligase [Candidatus Legionella polyplacis]